MARAAARLSPPRGAWRGARREIRVGIAGEQFALPEAVELARQIRRTKPSGDTITISAADPLNLCGIITPGEKVAAVASTQITFRDGVRRCSVKSTAAVEVPVELGVRVQSNSMRPESSSLSEWCASR